MTYSHEDTTRRTRVIASLAVVASVALPALAIWSPIAPLAIPLAIALPFAAMTVVESSIQRDRLHH